MNTLLLSSLMLLPGQPALQIQPAAVTLTGPNATQRLSVWRVEKSEVVADAARVKRQPEQTRP
ncbi:MAG: hypothetical protein HYR84_02080 [Planctomycetes bacterium]|nr:hypothetical protein [Planctomycetota bacterium]